MDLDTIIEKIKGTPKYESVKPDYLVDGTLMLTASRDGKQIIYNSKESYTITTESALLSLFSKRMGSPIKEQKTAPSISIKTVEGTVGVIYDKKNNATLVHIEENNKPTLTIGKINSQYVSNQNNITNNEIDTLVKKYRGVFKQESKLLDVKKHVEESKTVGFRDYC